MIKINEAEYEDFFSKETLDNLKNLSKDSAVPGISTRESQVKMYNTLMSIPQIEQPYKDMLEVLAVDLVEKHFPIIGHEGIEIKAKIGTPGTDELNENEEGYEEISAEEWMRDTPEEVKRRIINGITQGAAVRGSGMFVLFEEYLNDIDERLLEKYKNLMKYIWGTYDDEGSIAQLLNALAAGHKPATGTSKVRFYKKDNLNESEDEAPTQIVIEATGICFPILVHEIIKGLYEVLSLHGFGSDTKQNDRVVSNVDLLKNEPRDIQYGKFIYDALSKIYNDSNVNDSRVREYFFVDVYKMESDKFVEFIENAINNKLTPDQKRWANNTIDEIYNDLKQDDSDDVLFK